MSPLGGFKPGTRIFSTFLSLTLLLPPAFFFPFLRGFFGGSGCRTGACPDNRLLFLAALGAALGFFVPAGFFFGLDPQRHCASFFPAADVPFLDNAFPALLHSALLTIDIS